jgi:hypothetical protein
MCIMCGCGESGNFGDIKSQDAPMFTIGDIFGADIDELSGGGMEDRDSESTYNPSGEVEDDND